MPKSICPFCAWAACGSLLLLCVPELPSWHTPLGPATVWLLLVPFASALLRRRLQRARA